MRNAIRKSAPLLLLAALVSWFYWPEISFNIALRSPKALHLWYDIHRNSFDDDVPFSVVYRMHRTALGSVAAKTGDGGTEYVWKDKLGYPGHSTVFKDSDGWIEVETFTGNDTAFVWVRRHSENPVQPQWTELGPAEG